MSSDDPDRSAPDDRQVRRALVAFSELIQRLEEEGRLREAVPFLLERLGDLRRILFDYEVRTTERLMPVEDEDERRSRRVVREALDRYREMIEEWGEGWTPPEAEAGDDEEDGDGRPPEG